MDFLHFLLTLILVFVLVMHYNPEWFDDITKQLKIRTSVLRPEVSLFELLIIVMLLMIMAKLYG
tara:strand:+ start:253 stop:444 length:192 start_codon:yes stop_codon:yes gene_type:complete